MTSTPQNLHIDRQSFHTPDPISLGTRWRPSALASLVLVALLSLTTSCGGRVFLPSEVKTVSVTLDARGDAVMAECGPSERGSLELVVHAGEIASMAGRDAEPLWVTRVVLREVRRARQTCSAALSPPAGLALPDATRY